MRTGLIARKIGMTQIFEDNGTQVPVTVLHVDPCTVISIRNEEKHGYDALQLGCGDVKTQRLNKSERGYFAKCNITPQRYLKEFRVSKDHLADVGTVFKVDHFIPSQLVDVTGITIGKGFAGSMKRHGFGGLRATHGVSISHRSHGSTGNRQDPGKVFKNKKMAGHMGCTQVTKLNLAIHSINLEKNLIFIKGSVPGAKGSIVYIRDAIKAKTASN